MAPSTRLRTILITGSTEGVGRQTAIDLAAHPNNHVIIHGRTEEKCLSAIDATKRENGHADNVDYIVANLSSMKETSIMADEVARRFPSLNMLVCNAGILQPRRTESKDGLEVTFQINYLSHFILCNRLIDVLAANGPARIMVIGSVLHSWTPLNWSDPQAIKNYEKYGQFARSKLMMHMLAMALHRRMMLTDKAISVNVIELAREKRESNRSRSASALSTSDSCHSMTRSIGGLVTFIESPACDRMSGKYLDAHGKQIRPGADATDERQQERLWTYTAELCKAYL